MNKRDLHALAASLETLESLGRLFKNLWYEQIREEIRDEKVKAYLIVFEDAFPGLNQVVGFVREHAQALANGDGEALQEGFERLSRALLQGGRSMAPASGIEPIPEEEAEDVAFSDATGAAPEGDGQAEDAEYGDGLTSEERAALAAVDQKDIDSLFEMPGGEEEEDTADLFESGEQVAELGEAEGVEAEELGEEEDEGTATPPSEEMEGGEEDEDALAVMEDVGDVEDALEGEHAEEGLDQEEESVLVDQIDEESTEADEEPEPDPEAFAKDEEDVDEGGPSLEEEESVDLDDLLGDDDEGVAPGISADEMNALLEEDGKGSEAQDETPEGNGEPARPARKEAPAKSGPKKRKPSAKPRPKPKQPKPPAVSADEEGTISEDEIDALFG